MLNQADQAFDVSKKKGGREEAIESHVIASSRLRLMSPNAIIVQRQREITADSAIY